MARPLGHVLRNAAVAVALCLPVFQILGVAGDPGLGMVDLPCRTRPGKLTDASVGWKARDEVIVRRYCHCVGLGVCTRGADGLYADHMTQVISCPVGRRRTAASCAIANDRQSSVGVAGDF
jgi:hypothetical protein